MMKKSTQDRIFDTFVPVVAGVVIASLFMYFLDFGETYKDILRYFISPIITGIVSGSVLYVFGVRKK